MSSRRRPFTVDDLELHHKLVSTTCSADGALAVCAVKTVDREQDKHVERRRVWLRGLARWRSRGVRAHA